MFKRNWIHWEEEWLVIFVVFFVIVLAITLTHMKSDDNINSFGEGGSLFGNTPMPTFSGFQPISPDSTPRATMAPLFAATPSGP